MQKAVFDIPKMDCPSEEKLIRLALSEVPAISLLQFDLPGRRLTVFHETEVDKVLQKLIPLNFGASLFSNDDVSELEENLLMVEKAREEGREKSEFNVLKQLLIINGVMFFIEIILGIMSQSTGLIADAMDMFADAAVYGVSLYAVGKTVSLQKKAARLAGYAQLILALSAMSEVIRRGIYGSDPEPGYMMWVSLFALIANVSCLLLIFRHREGGAHMKASYIFSANDVIANLGVIVAGVLVKTFNSSVPDLVIGGLISILVLRGAISIFKISAKES